MEYTSIQLPQALQVQNILGYGGQSPKPQEWQLAFPCTFRREMPFENEIYLSKDHGSYMAMGVYLQNLKEWLPVFLCNIRRKMPLIQLPWVMQFQNIAYSYAINQRTSPTHTFSRYFNSLGQAKVCKGLGQVSFYFYIRLLNGKLATQLLQKLPNWQPFSR